VSSHATRLIGSSCLRHGVAFWLLDATRIFTMGGRHIGFRGLMPSTVSAPLYRCLRTRSSYHAAFRAVGLTTARHRLIAVDDWDSARSFARGNFPVSVFPHRRKDSLMSDHTATDDDSLRHSLARHRDRGISRIYLEAAGHGERLKCLLLKGLPAMSIGRTVPGVPETPETLWRPATLTEADQEFLTRATTALPTMAVLELEFTRDTCVGHIVVDASVNPRIEDYVAVDSDQAAEAVATLVSDHCGSLSPALSSRPVAVRISIDGQGPGIDSVTDELRKRLTSGGVSMAELDESDRSLSASGLPENIAAACVDTAAAVGSGVTLRCEPV
jgi:hypothetical protein